MVSDISNFSYHELSSKLLPSFVIEYAKSNKTNELRYKIESLFSIFIIRNISKYLVFELSKKVLERITDEKEKAITAIQNAIEDIKTKEEFLKMDTGNQNKIILPFKEEINKL